MPVILIIDEPVGNVRYVGFPVEYLHYSEEKGDSHDFYDFRPVKPNRLTFGVLRVYLLDPVKLFTFYLFDDGAESFEGVESPFQAEGTRDHFQQRQNNEAA
jgi:hypothetical protein